MKKSHKPSLRLISLLIIGLLAFTLAACDGSGNAADEVEVQTEEAQDALGDAMQRTQNAFGELAESVEAAAGAVTETVQESLTDARAEAVERLEQLNVEEQTEETLNEAEQTLVQTREQLQAAYENAGEAAQEQWQALEPRFEEVETALREGSADALNQLQDLIGELEQGIEPQ